MASELLNYQRVNGWFETSLFNNSSPMISIMNHGSNHNRLSHMKTLMQWMDKPRCTGWKLEVGIKHREHWGLSSDKPSTNSCRNSSVHSITGNTLIVSS